MVLVAPVVSYLGGEVEYPKSLYVFGFIYFALAAILWKKLPFRSWFKIIFVVSSFVVAVFATTSLIFLTMILPGSKEHNYVMYSICEPAMRRHYGIKEGEHVQKTGEPVDKNGSGKWWYQHLECEQNVYNGKGPIFSENPPGFKPIR